MNSNVSGLDAVGEKKTISIVGYKQWLEILKKVSIGRGLSDSYTRLVKNDYTL